MTMPPAVAVTAPITGVSERYFHRTAPVLASTAVTHPVGTVLPSPGTTVPPRCKPRGEYLVPGVRLTTMQLSTEPTKSVIRRGSNAGPFHNTPPAAPGQMRVPSVVTVLRTGSTVVTGVLNRTLRVARSTM